MKNIEMMTQMFAGLGLFFVGMHKVSAHMKELGGPYAQRIIGSLAGSDLKALMGGFISGLATNSGKAVTFTIAGISSGGLLSLRKGLPIVMGGSIGSAFIVLWSSFDFKELVFVIFGIVGLYYQFGDMKHTKKKAIVRALLGFGLLFYGLELIKIGAAPIKEFHWFTQFIVDTKDYWLIAMFTGTLGAIVSQSGSNVAIITMPLVSAGILGMDQAIMLVLGTNLGSGICTALLALGLSGVSKRLVLFHAIFKSVGILVMVPLIYLESYTHLPLIKHLVTSLTGNLNTQLALVYVLYELVTALIIWGLLDWFSRHLGRHQPMANQEFVPTQ